eukprot:2837606-Prorocentrum_lima.AAC.1
MTSSLVGSEMCIRDRLICRALALPWMLCGSSNHRRFQLQSLMPPMGLLAVSYTHLTLPTICSV